MYYMLLAVMGILMIIVSSSRCVIYGVNIISIIMFVLSGLVFVSLMGDRYINREKSDNWLNKFKEYEKTAFFKYYYLHLEKDYKEKEVKFNRWVMNGFNENEYKAMSIIDEHSSIKHGNDVLIEALGVKNKYMK